MTLGHNWGTICEITGRTYVVCRYRWLYLSKFLKPMHIASTRAQETVLWTSEMEIVLRTSIVLFGRNWSIASQLIGNGPTASDCHARFRSHGASMQWQQNMVSICAISNILKLFLNIFCRRII